MARRVVPRCDGKTDLVVKLCRRRNVALLLDMESHAGGTGLNVATIRSELSRDNWGCVLWICDNFRIDEQRLGVRGQRAADNALLVVDTCRAAAR